MSRRRKLEEFGRNAEMQKCRNTRITYDQIILNFRLFWKTIGKTQIQPNNENATKAKVNVVVVIKYDVQKAVN